MEERQQVFVFASPAIQGLLADNGLDVAELLRMDGHDVQVSLAENPAQTDDTGYKEPATVILASAGLVVALTPIVKRLISALTHKSVVVHDMLLVPVVDPQGNVVHDRIGQPILQWVRKTEIVESSERAADRSRISIKGYGVEIGYNDVTDTE